MSATRRANAVRPHGSGRQYPQLGQLLVVRLGLERWSSGLGRWLRRVNPGGIILSSPGASEKSVLEFLLHAVQALAAPPFLLLEPGSESESSHSLQSAPSPAEAARQGTRAVERLGEQTGAALRRAGFNTVLAPLLDLLPFRPKDRLARQAFGPDPAWVARCGWAFVRGLDRQKVLACAAHFPGLGDVLLHRPSTLPLPRLPSGQGLPVIGKSMAELWRADLVPFRQLLPRLSMIRMSPAAYKAYDFDHPRPAVFSEKVVDGLLRTKLSYQGVALADLEDAIVRSLAETDDAAVRALQAGSDLLILAAEEGKTERVLDRIAKAVESGELSPRRLDQALRRVHKVKRALAGLEGKIG